MVNCDLFSPSAPACRIMRAWSASVSCVVKVKRPDGMVGFAFKDDSDLAKQFPDLALAQVLKAMAAAAEGAGHPAYVGPNGGGE